MGVWQWVVVALHRPMYFTGMDGLPWEVHGYDYALAAEMRRVYEPLLGRFGVDLVLAGHHHSYQRTCPILNRTCFPGPDTHLLHAQPGLEAWPRRAPVHLVVGMGGYANTPLLEVPARIFAMTDDKHHGFVRITARPQVPLHTRGRVGGGECGGEGARARLVRRHMGEVGGRVTMSDCARCAAVLATRGRSWCARKPRSYYHYIPCSAHSMSRHSCLAAPPLLQRQA